ncbi:MAG TPA: TIM barrel protein [Planctomycetota bacterium]|nr:TIM barrel protein [Planctomycetota bacterium]
MPKDNARPEAAISVEKDPGHMTRRRLLGHAAAGGLLAAAGFTTGLRAAPDEAKKSPAAPSGKIKQSACRWCYSKVPLDDLAKHCAEIGLKSVELLGPDDFATVKKHGLTCAMVLSHSIHPGLNDKKNHDSCLGLMRKRIGEAAEAGFPSVICFSGNREKIPDDVGIENCALALKKIVGFAEEKKITLCMELLNSKVDHKDYQCDRTPWGVEIVKRVGSPRFKLLYDIYHMQIMEGDVIRTIRQYHEYIGHYHTGGNPGRHEIDDTQELNYAAVMRAIAETGYEGYVGQEFIPTREPIASLRQAFDICNV